MDAIVVSADGGEQIYTLKGAEEPYRVLFEQMNEGAVTIAEDGGILYANQSFARVMKVPLEHVIGTNFENYILSSDLATFRDMIIQSVHEPVRDEVVFKDNDGTSVPMQLSISSLPTAKVPTYCIVVADLTERVQAEEALKNANEQLENKVQERTKELSESEAKYRSMFENLQEMVGVFKYVSGRARHGR